jgi:ferredoxin--NADP+ reductase
MSNPSLRAAVIGAGPSGFYASEQLLQAGFEVDLVDVLPTPFGLVRAGVAPDHPKIKSVTRVYEKTATRAGFRFFGGVELGADITRTELLERYHAVVYALGTSDDNRLRIPGEDRPGSYPATRFVAWYNGHPGASGEDFDLGARRAVVIGNGNVALDVARMLALEPGELARTDTADHALRALAGARIDPQSARWLAEAGTPTAKRNVERLREFSQLGPTGKPRRITLRFLCSPVEVLGEGTRGPVSGLRVARNRIEPGRQGGLRAVPSGQLEDIDCGLVLRSIGYRGRPVDDVPFDERHGLIRNEGGRVCDEEARPHRGEYVVGWIKRGPSGVIGTNKKDAAETVAKIVEDEGAGALNEPSNPDRGAAADWIFERVPTAVEWDGWVAIDERERKAGEPAGRPRVKLVTHAELREAAAAARRLAVGR